jgi:hypothetical protein
MRGAYGGNLLKGKYEGTTAAQTASLMGVKTLFNSTLSTPNAKFLTLDLKDFFLTATLPKPEYCAIPLADIPTEIIDEYTLNTFAYNNPKGKAVVLFEVTMGMYGLPHAGYLAQEELKKFLLTHNFIECPHTPACYKHKSRPIQFSLVVDDFGVQYTHESDAQFLIDILKTKYELTVDWGGAKYIGLNLRWDYAARTLAVSMDGYAMKGVKQFLGVDAVTTPTHSPAPGTRVQYGIQRPLPSDLTPLLPMERIRRVQSVVGYFLYYARAVDPTMLVRMGQISTRQAQATEAVEDECAYFLHYVATYPNAHILYRASDMIYKVVSDASYLSELFSRSRAGGAHFFGFHNSDAINGMIHTLCTLIDCVCSSAAEAELAALFYNAKIATEIRNTCADLGWPQQATPIESDNKCAVGISNSDTKARQSRAMDMRFHWIADRVRQGHFTVAWKSGSTNIADYFTKIHMAKHHRIMRNTFVYDPPQLARNTAQMRRHKKAPRNLTECIASHVRNQFDAPTIMRH